MSRHRLIGLARTPAIGAIQLLGPLPRGPCLLQHQHGLEIVAVVPHVPDRIPPDRAGIDVALFPEEERGPESRALHRRRTGTNVFFGSLMEYPLQKGKELQGE